MKAILIFSGIVLLGLSGCTTPPALPNTGAATDGTAVSSGTLGAGGSAFNDGSAQAIPFGQEFGSGTFAGDSGTQGFGSAEGDGVDPSRLVYFAYDSYQVPAEAEEVIGYHARILIDNPSLQATLEGHTDVRGTRNYNLGLSERRSDAVRQRMMLYGASPVQLRSLSYGEERPAQYGEDEASHAANRRVVIRY